MKSLNENIIYLFLICLLFGFIFQLYYLTEPLLDFHSFRQTQTAITSYWFLKEDFKFAYQTPLFGFPWSIPMEFPLYQFIVYLFVKIFNISNLDFTGRIVSLTFYYALFYPFWNILKNFRINTEDIVIIFIFLVTSPIYIFWSRTFMIESTGLFFTLMFLMYVLKYDQEKYINFKLLSMILLFGILAVLTKITSLLVGLLFLSFFTIFFHKIKYLICKKNLLLIVFLTLIIFIGFIWNNFADITKSENHLSEFLMSNNLTSWNFGTFEQRLEIINYKIILNHIINNTPLFFLILPFLFFKTIIKNDYKKLIFISILTYLSTFLILFNLYKVHNYYWYANSIFLIILIGLITSSIVNIFKKNFYKYLIIIFFIGINFFVYSNTQDSIFDFTSS